MMTPSLGALEITEVSVGEIEKEQNKKANQSLCNLNCMQQELCYLAHSPDHYKCSTHADKMNECVNEYMQRTRQKKYIEQENLGKMKIIQIKTSHHYHFLKNHKTSLIFIKLFQHVIDTIFKRTISHYYHFLKKL